MQTLIFNEFEAATMEGVTRWLNYFKVCEYVAIYNNEKLPQK